MLPGVSPVPPVFGADPAEHARGHARPGVPAEQRGGPPEPPPCGASPRQCLLLAYERYLSGERSLGQSTIAKYSRIAGAFLDMLPDPVDDALAGLSAGQVHGFVLSRGSGAKSIAGGLGRSCVTSS